MTLMTWITPLAMASTLTLSGLAYAQQPSPPAQPKPTIIDRTPIVGGTSVIGADGKPITTVDHPTVERTPIAGGTSLIGADGKPITGGTTSFGQR